MRVEVVGDGTVISADGRDWVERAARLSLSRYASRVRVVSLTVVDVNGPRQGPDKVCRVSVRANGLDEIVVEQIAESVGEAVRRAIRRAERRLARQIDRRLTSRSRALPSHESPR